MPLLPLGQLSIFGTRARQRILGSPGFSPWGPAAWGTSQVATPAAWPQSPNGPSGVVLHYTAAATLSGTVEWFCRPDLNAMASAHYVVGRQREPWAADLCSDLPFVRDLPVTVVECRPRGLPAYHATWANCIFAGIELVNWGCAVPDTRMVTGLPGSPPAASPPYGTAVAAGRTWQRYTPQQIAALATLLGAMAQADPIQPWGVVGHEHVQGTATRGATGCDKRDPGPLLDLAALRSQVWPGLVQSGSGLTPWVQDLAALGYHPWRQGLTPSVQLFQRLMGLEPDGVAGPLTLKALRDRRDDRGLPAVSVGG